MLSLLAESKTMSDRQEPVSPEEFQNHKAVLESTADSIMNYWEGLSPEEIAQRLGVSNSLAIKSKQLAYDFPNKSIGNKAVFSFIGEAYKGLDITSLSEDAFNRCEDGLRIISSVYGILKPSDIIKPYRFEFNKVIGGNFKTSIKTFKSKVTIDLVNYIKSNKVKDIIDLLPGDADKCVDWKIVRAFASVHKICFQTIEDGGKLKTPIARSLKELRGRMCRLILEKNLQSFEDLKNTHSDHFIYSEEFSKPGLPVFIETIG